MSSHMFCYFSEKITGNDMSDGRSMTGSEPEVGKFTTSHKSVNCASG